MLLKSLAFTKILILGSFFLLVPNLYAQQMSVTIVGSLNFGTFAKLNGGTITIAPDGSTSTTGDIMLVSSGLPQSTVRFDLTTNFAADKLVAVTSVATPLTGPGGSLELAVSLDQTLFNLNKTTPQSVQMGGTLTIGPEDLSGVYTGSVTVTFSYQ